MGGLEASSLLTRKEEGHKNEYLSIKWSSNLNKISKFQSLY